VRVRTGRASVNYVFAVSTRITRHVRNYEPSLSCVCVCVYAREDGNDETKRVKSCPWTGLQITRCFSIRESRKLTSMTRALFHFSFHSRSLSPCFETENGRRARQWKDGWMASWMREETEEMVGQRSRREELRRQRERWEGRGKAGG